jgi:hypothetical protein
VTLSRWLLSLLQFGPPAPARPSTTLRVILDERLSTAPLRLPRPSLLDSAGALHLGMFQRALARAVPGFSCVPTRQTVRRALGQLEAARSRLARTAKLEMYDLLNRCDVGPRPGARRCVWGGGLGLMAAGFATGTQYYSTHASVQGARRTSCCCRGAQPPMQPRLPPAQPSPL